MKNGLLDTIKTRGYWRINFQPMVATRKLQHLAACKEIVARSSVELRGWGYPHFPMRIDADSGIEPANDHYQAWIEWENHKEFWRMYQSGQFIHYLALREDWLEEDSWYTSGQKPKPGTALSVVGTIYQLTEIFEFLSRLSKAGLYDEGVSVAISLENTAQRSLWLNDPGRVPLSRDYKTAADRILLKNQYTRDQTISASREASAEMINQIFDRFGWHSTNKDDFRQDQENLLKKRF